MKYSYDYSQLFTEKGIVHFFNFKMAANYNIYFEITQKVAIVQQNSQNLF